VAADGTRVAIGANGDQWNGGNTGAVYVFERDGAGAWNERQKLTASDGASGDYFGESVAADTGVLAAGAYGQDGPVVLSIGSVYMFGGPTPIAIPGPSSPLVINGKAYFGANDGRLYEIDVTVAAPSPKWIELGDSAVPKTVGAPGYDVQSGRLIVGTDEGRIYSVEVPL
jgi:hypothetical protein